MQILTGAIPMEIPTGAIPMEILTGTEASDIIIQGNSRPDVINGLGGNDVIYRGYTVNPPLVINGGAGTDLVSYKFSEPVIASLANNALNGGNAFRDTYISIESLEGSRFNDTLYGDHKANWLLGNDGNDSLFGGAGNDRLWGQDGNDFLAGGTGADTLIGGDGTDLVSYKFDYEPVTASLANNALNRGDAIGDVYISIENLEGSKHNDTLYGDHKANWLLGNDGNDSLSGDSGNDRLWGQSGNDLLEGDDGNDTLIGGAGRDELIGGAGEDTFMFSGEFGNDTILDFAFGTDVLFFHQLGTGAGDVAAYILDSTTYIDNDVIISTGQGTITLQSIEGELSLSDIQVT